MGVFLDGNTVKTEYYLRNIYKCAKQDLNNNFFKNIYLKQSDATTLFSKICDFCGWLFECKNGCKNSKNIWKSPKRNLTNNFVRNLDKYSTGYTQIQTMSQLFKEPVAIFGFFEVKTLAKLKITLKIIANMTKMTALTILSKTLIYVLNNRSNFGWCYISLRDL